MAIKIKSIITDDSKPEELSKEQADIIKSFSEKMSKQQDCPAEIVRMVDENLWDMV